MVSGKKKILLLKKDRDNPVNSPFQAEQQMEANFSGSSSTSRQNQKIDVGGRLIKGILQRREDLPILYGFESHGRSQKCRKSYTALIYVEKLCDWISGSCIGSPTSVPIGDGVNDDSKELYPMTVPDRGLILAGDLSC
ncbi:hypothetical protein Bca52824_075209 [Brassica carinata]|uniref:Uncharacterized protein n=1 Tax=Brassica carinata TaxID=52824 RepID=A0A8X7TV74_BRACI|nr:hypothetical protein Bca52824_075209 [Brassica carinata]